VAIELMVLLEHDFGSRSRATETHLSSRNEHSRYKRHFSFTEAHPQMSDKGRICQLRRTAHCRRPIYPAPQRYGYNIIRLYPDAGATSVTVTFHGVTGAPASPDWRWGLVATDAGITKARYSAMQKGADAALTFCVNAGESLFLVVTATPSTQQTIVWISHTTQFRAIRT
jgi:hypothetical protein